MPLTHIATFKVRHYECDAYGHLNNANYLRYMQEAAFAASAAAGYDLARYAALGSHWLIRETEIEYRQPVRYGDTVEVKTWVADFRKVRSRRAYEFRRVGTDDLVAVAQTDWVYLDSSSGRPAPIPPAMIAAFFPEGGTPPALPRQPFPPVPPPPPGVFKQHRRVEWRDIDQAQHVNNAVYLSYLDECGFGVSAAYGWPLARMSAVGVGVVARRLRIAYLQPAVMDDELAIATWVFDVGRIMATRHYRIERVADGALVAQANVLYVWVDLTTGRPIRIPPCFLLDFAPNIAA